MSTRLIHRPAQDHPARGPPPRHAPSRPPPNLPEGKSGNIAMSLLPMAGVMSSVVMMTVIRNSQFAGLGAIILVVTVIGSVALFFSQRGKAQRTRRTQREALSGLSGGAARGARRRGTRAARTRRDPQPAAGRPVRHRARPGPAVGAPPLRRRLPAGARRHRRNARTRSEDRSAGLRRVLTPPDRFMLNEASALMARFRTGTELPLTVPLDRVGNVSVIGPREDCPARRPRPARRRPPPPTPPTTWRWPSPCPATGSPTGSGPSGCRTCSTPSSSTAPSPPAASPRPHPSSPGSSAPTCAGAPPTRPRCAAACPARTRCP